MNRFLVENETVTDIQTGLTWIKNASLFEFPLSWDEALTSVTTLNRQVFGGHDDWRLPNRRELFSLVSHETINPCLPGGHPFDNVFNGYYWTSTTCARLPDQAWYIHLGGARIFKGMKYASYMVWPVRNLDGSQPVTVFQTGQVNCYDTNGNVIPCGGTGQDADVRSGQALPENRFSKEGRCVLDRATGLTWLQDANLFKNSISWQKAHDLVSEMNHRKESGYGDWRIPGIRELESLTDMGRHSPALPEGHPFQDVQDFYWSSTTSRYNQSYAWALYAVDGIIGVAHKPLSEFFLWPVRCPVN